MWFDHVPIAVRDLDEACEAFRRRYGLGWSGAGRHPQGTVNRAIPVSSTEYIELLAIDDPAGAWSADVRTALDRGEPLMGWSIEVDDIEAVAERVGVAAEHGTVQLEDDATGTWSTVSSDSEGLPFFIRYARSHAERAAANVDRLRQADHGCEPRGFAWMEVGGDERRLREWLGECPLDVRHVGGRPGMSRFAVRTEAGELVIGAADIGRNQD